MAVIDLNPERLNQKILSRALPVVQHILPARMIEGFAHACGHEWRERCLGPALTLVACVYKQLHGASARSVEDWLASLGDEACGAVRDGHGFCAARARLPLAVFQMACRHLAGKAIQCGGEMLGALRVLIVDGTTLRMPRTKKNSRRFGHSRSGPGGRTKSRLPLARMVALCCMGTGAVLDLAMGPFRQSEAQLLRILLERLGSGALIVADRGFCSFLFLWLAQTRGVHVLTRLHQTRKDSPVKRLAENDEIHEWSRPKKGWVRWADCVGLAPRTIQVRVITARVKRKGYREATLKICTTLLDAERYPAEPLIALYLKRWNIELDFRAMKSAGEMARLTGKTPEIVEKEVHSIVLAHNTVRATMAQSGKKTRRLSAERTRQLLLETCAQMSRAPIIQLPGLYRRLLEQVGATMTKHQTRPPEPRQIVELNRSFPAMHLTRAQWRRKYAG